jgi:hypothetical protein
MERSGGGLGAFLVIGTLKLRCWGKWTMGVVGD